MESEFQIMWLPVFCCFCFILLGGHVPWASTVSRLTCSFMCLFYLVDANNPELSIHIHNIHIYIYVLIYSPIHTPYPKGSERVRQNELRILKQGTWSPSDLAPLVCPRDYGQGI